MPPEGSWFWRDLYERAGMDPLYDRSVVRLARSVLGPEGVRLVTSGEFGLTCDAALITDSRGRVFIGVRASVEPIRVPGLIAHELCEHRCQRIGYRRPDRERVCNRQARAILAPDPAMIVAGATLTGGLRAFAAHFLMTDVQMALRLGEVPGGPAMAVYTRGRIVVADPRGQLPTQLELRRLFSEGGDARHVLLDTSDPANTQVLMRRAED